MLVTIGARTTSMSLSLRLVTSMWRLLSPLDPIRDKMASTPSLSDSSKASKVRKQWPCRRIIVKRVSKSISALGSI